MALTMAPFVSIIMPVWNGAGYIAGAVESVLAQDFTDWELIIIDDGSTDGTAGVLNPFLGDPRIAYHKNETNLGIQKTLNRGLQLARGEYIARIDDDDRWTDRQKLSAQMQHLKKDFSCVLVGTGVIIIDEESAEISRFLPPLSDAAIRSSILGQNCFSHSTVLFSKKAALEAGGYGESADERHVEDYGLWLRMGPAGTFANLPIYAASLTSRAQSLSNRNRLLQARRSLRLAWKHRNNYPRLMAGLLTGLARLAFFAALSVIPLSRGRLFKLQSLIKGGANQTAN